QRPIPGAIAGERSGTDGGHRIWLVHGLEREMSKPTHCTRRRLVLSTLGVLTAGWSLPGWTARSTSPAVILVVGDSLSAEYGIARDSGWVALLTQRLRQLRPQDRVINASISGDTTSGGRTRLPALLKQHQPTHVVIELGANDALRGFP